MKWDHIYIYYTTGSWNPSSRYRLMSRLHRREKSSEGKSDASFFRLLFYIGSFVKNTDIQIPRGRIQVQELTNEVLLTRTTREDEKRNHREDNPRILSLIWNWMLRLHNFIGGDNKMASHFLWSKTENNDLSLKLKRANNTTKADEPCVVTKRPATHTLLSPSSTRLRSVSSPDSRYTHTTQALNTNKNAKKKKKKFFLSCGFGKEHVRSGCKKRSRHCRNVSEDTSALFRREYRMSGKAPWVYLFSTVGTTDTAVLCLNSSHFIRVSVWLTPTVWKSTSYITCHLKRRYDYCIDDTRALPEAFPY